ncbi:MAG: hypothetical protein IPL24_05940 [Bacteroidetes bacterium]|nr:hypothetical protein [Bacteroidota bacterium]
MNKKAFAPKITINSVVFDRIFGGNTIDIRPQGNAELSFGVNINKSENPAIPLDQRTVTTFDFKEKIQMNVIANIGDKMKLTTNYNTEATFDFSENKMKIEYTVMKMTSSKDRSRKYHFDFTNAVNSRITGIIRFENTITVW